MNKNDYKNTNTKLCLANAFHQYLNTNGATLDLLTIGKLTQLANVHRVTFYHHFLSMTDFIKWYLHKDLIFQLNGNDVLSIEVSLNTIYEFIHKNRLILQKIISSGYGPAAQTFITEEAMTYQLTNMKRIDSLEHLSSIERRIYAGFYSKGIQHMILDYIVDPIIQGLPIDEYVSYCVMLIKNYIEKLIEEKNPTK